MIIIKNNMCHGVLDSLKSVYVGCGCTVQQRVGIVKMLLNKRGSNSPSHIINKRSSDITGKGQTYRQWKCGCQM